MRNVLMSMCVITIALTTGSASAFISDCIVITAPDTLNSTANVPSLGTILDQSKLNDIYDTGSTQAQINDGTKSVYFSLLLEDAGFANTNTFGIYNIENPDVKLQIFSGSDHPYESIKVKFDTKKDIAWIDSDNKVSMGTTFGFYIDSSFENQGGVFYSDPSLNTGSDFGVQHTLLFNTSKVKDYPDMVVAFEDLTVTSSMYDRDYNDMVVGVSASSINPVPEPTTIAVLSLGMVILSRKRK